MSLKVPMVHVHLDKLKNKMGLYPEEMSGSHIKFFEFISLEKLLRDLADGAGVLLRMLFSS